MAKDEAKWAYWTKQIKDWQASGLSRNAYCKREDLRPGTFDYWRPLIVGNDAQVKAVKQATAGSNLSLVPVKVTAVDIARDVDVNAMAPGGPRPAAHPEGQPLKLKSPSGWEMQLPSNVNTDWLIDLLRRLP